MSRSGHPKWDHNENKSESWYFSCTNESNHNHSLKSMNTSEEVTWIYKKKLVNNKTKIKEKVLKIKPNNFKIHPVILYKTLLLLFLFHNQLRAMIA